MALTDASTPIIIVALKLSYHKGEAKPHVVLSVSLAWRMGKRSDAVAPTRTAGSSYQLRDELLTSSMAGADQLVYGMVIPRLQLWQDTRDQ